VSATNLRRSSIIAGLGATAAAGFARRPARAADLIPLRVGGIPIDPSAQCFYAQDLGMFKEAGLDVTLTVLGNGASVIAATASGALDIASGSPGPVLLAHSQGIAMKFIATGVVYAGVVVNAALMVLKNSPLRSGADFNGKRIGVGGLHDMTSYSIQAWIDHGGGDSKTVEFVELPYAAMAVALEQNRVDAVGIIEPFITGAKSVAQIAGNLNDAVSNHYLLSGWCAESGWLARNGEAARRFFVAMQRSAQWANAHQKESGVILQRYTKIAPEVMATMARSHYDETVRVDVSEIQPVINVMAKYGNLKPFPATDVIWTPPSA
jgi:NitT/TauT family transport system substrate-binding protein